MEISEEREVEEVTIEVVFKNGEMMIWMYVPLLPLILNPYPRSQKMKVNEMFTSFEYWNIALRICTQMKDQRPLVAVKSL